MPTLPPVLAILDLPLVGTVVLHTYGVMRALAIVVGVVVGRWAFARRGIDPDHVYWALIWVAPAGLVGAALGGVASRVGTALREGASVVEAAVSALNTGGTYFLALPLVALAVVVYARVYALPAWRALDSLALPIAAAMPVQRLGCFASGCCYGTPTTLPWAVTYTSPYGSWPQSAPRGVPLHPAQLYEGLGVAALFVVLAWMLWRGRTRDEGTSALRLPDGSVFWAFVLGYCAIRFVVEFVRDSPRPFLWEGGLSVPQGICLLGVAVAAIELRRRRAETLR